MAKGITMMKGTNWLLECEALVVPLAVPLGLDAVIASWFALITLYPPSSTGFSREDLIS